MKILKLTLLTIMTACLTFSCKSDDDAISGNSSELIIGTWRWTASTENGEAQTLSECDLMDTFIFTSTNATYVSHESDSGNSPCTSNTSTGTYSIDGNNISEVNQSETTTYEIVTLNSTTLTIKYVEVDGNETYIYTETYTKQ